MNLMNISVFCNEKETLTLMTINGNLNGIYFRNCLKTQLIEWKHSGAREVLIPQTLTPIFRYFWG